MELIVIDYMQHYAWVSYTRNHFSIALRTILFSRAFQEREIILITKYEKVDNNIIKMNIRFENSKIRFIAESWWCWGVPMFSNSILLSMNLGIIIS
jgi:hypothetical protein